MGVYGKENYPAGTPEGLTPTQRMAAVLRYLAFRKAAVPTDDLRALTVDYGGDEGAGALRRDLRELRERGLVETGLRTHPRLAGVRLRHATKHPDLHLTRGEPAGLTPAPRRLRRGPAAAARGRRGRHLDLALAVVRYLEEGVGRATGRELAAALGCPVPDLHAALLAFVSNPTADPADQMPDSPALPNLVFNDEDFAEDADDDADDAAAVTDFTVALDSAEVLLDADARAAVPRARRLAHDRGAGGLSHSPTAGIGLDVFGRFAYTVAETDERLTLVDRALDDPATSDADRDALLSAGGKLAEWRQLVERLS